MHNNYLKIMGKKRDLQPAEKTTIVQQLAEGMSTLQIARNLGREHLSVKKFVADSQRGRKKREERVSEAVCKGYSQIEAYSR